MSYDIVHVIFAKSRIPQQINQPDLDARGKTYNRKLKNFVRISYGMCCIWV